MLRGARCVFAYTTFQLIHKDHLAFFEKKGLEKFRNSFFFYNRQNEMSKKREATKLIESLFLMGF